MENKRIIQVEEKVPFKMLVPLSIQHMFAMFGASVLVPFVFGINPAVVLFMNGIGTLFFILITKGRAPAYLGSSFAFLAPAGVVISKWGYEYALGGFVVVGFLGCILAVLIYKFGSDWIDVVLPPAAMGPVVALIGLELAGTAASNAGLTDEVIDVRNVIVFLVTLLVAVLGSVLFRGFLSVIPILIAIIAGYIAALACGIVDFSQVAAAPLFSLPNFSAPKFKWEAIVIIIPVLLVITSEHIGHQIVTAFRTDRFRADNDIRREYRCHGDDKGLQCICDRRCGCAVHHLFLYRKNDHTDQYDPGTCHWWYLVPTVRYDRNIGYPYSGRVTGGL